MNRGAGHAQAVDCPVAGLGPCRARKPWPGFLLRVLLALAAVLAGGAYLGTRYHIGIDDQVVKCLPPYTVFLIDRWDKHIRRDRPFVFRSERMDPYFPDGTIVIKLAEGLPGDQIRVFPEGVTVNGKTVAGPLVLAATVGRSRRNFAREGVVPPFAYVAIGRHPQSFDSRYWGFVRAHQVIGRAYALF